jgi:hypothetical protein
MNVLGDAIVSNLSYAAVDYSGDLVVVHELEEGVPVDGAGGQGLDAAADIVTHGCAAEGQEEV